MAKEKRFALRISANLPAELWGVDDISFLCGVRLIELSPGGCKISLEKQELSLPQGLTIKFGLEKAIPFNFSAEIVWSNKSDEKIYIGIKFKNLTMHDKEKTRKYIHDLKYINRDGYTM